MTNMGRGEILSADIKRYQQILEYVNLSGHLDEVGEDPNADPNAGGAPAPGGDPNAMGGAPGGDPGMGGAPGGDPNAMGGDPNAMGGDPNEQGGVEGFDPQAGAGEGPNAMGGDPGMGDPNAMGDPMADMGGEQPGPDDNVIDIDDLTNSQDETNTMIQDLNDKFEKLLGVVDKFDKFIDKNDSEIASLKQELEKRNPTPLEKLDLRTVNDSYPFNVKPNDYWKGKEETSNYRVGGDTDEVPAQYDLHQSDVDDVQSWKAIADSLDDSSLTDLTRLFNLNESVDEYGCTGQMESEPYGNDYDDIFGNEKKFTVKINGKEFLTGVPESYIEDRGIEFFQEMADERFGSGSKVEIIPQN